MYNPTPWSKVLFEKLTGSLIVKKFPAFYGSLPNSQQPATCPYSEPDESSKCLPPLIPLLSPRHGAPSGCGWSNRLQYGG